MNWALNKELISCDIGVYYYDALTNSWAQFYLPTVEELDQQNKFHILVQRAVDQSVADFTAMAQVLGRVDQQKLQQNSLTDLLNGAITR